MTAKPTRPALRYPGGKWKLAPWIIKRFPAHHAYIEPYGGAASVLLRKERAYLEVYNDLDEDVVNLFRILRDPDQAQALVQAVALTPYARQEFELAYDNHCGPIESARRLLVRSGMGYGASAVGKWRTGFRGNCRRTGASAALTWLRLPEPLLQVAQRLQGVVIECRPALEVIARYDADDTLFYVDPPYPASTRGRWAQTAYCHEMSDDEHRDLAQALHQVKGMVVLSGYACDLYKGLFSDWRCVRRQAYADGARKRVECLWLSPRVGGRQLGMFEGV